MKVISKILVTLTLSEEMLVTLTFFLT